MRRIALSAVVLFIAVAFLLCISGLAEAACGGSPSTQLQEWKALCSEAQRLFDTGELSRAENAYVQALQLARTIPNNVNATLSSLHDLAAFYMNARRFDKATQTLSECLAVQSNMVGVNDPGLAMNLNALGVSYRELHRYVDAEAAHQRALSLLKNATPEASSEIGMTLSALGSVEDVQCHFAKAQSYFARALDYLDRAHSKSSDLARVGTLDSLASEYLLLGQVEKARPLFAAALKIIDTPQHEQTELLLQTLDRAAMLQCAQKNFTSAEKLWNRAVSITNPESRFYRLVVLIHLAELQCYLKEQERAKDLLNRAEQLYDQLYQTHGDLYAMILADRGLVAITSGDKEKAAALLDRALNVSRTCHDRDVVRYSNILRYRAMVAERQHDLITAKTMLKEASQIHQKVLGESPVTADCFFAYARVLKKLKLKSEAKEYEQTAKAMLDVSAGNESTAYTVDVKALRHGW